MSVDVAREAGNPAQRHKLHQAGAKLGKQYRGRTGSSANSSQALVLGPCSYSTACAATLIPSIYLAPDLRVEAQELPHE